MSPPETLAPPSATLATASLPPRVARVLDGLLRRVRERLDIHFDRALDDLDQQLFELAGQARDPDAQATHQAMRQHLRRHRAQLFPAFMAELEARLAVLRGHGALDRHGHPRAHRQLCLVDDQQLEEETALREIAQRQEARASLPLHLLGQRFGVLARDAAFDPARLPLGPRALADALRASSQAMPLDAAARRLLFQAFERTVMVAYEPLARELDEALADAGVLPGLTHVPLRVRPSAAPPAAAPVPVPATTPDTPTTPVPAATGDTLDEAELFALVRRLLATQPGVAAPAASTTATLAAVASPGAGTSAPVTANALPRGGAAPDARGDDAAALALLDLLLHEVGRAMRRDAPARALLDRLREPLRRLTARDRGVLTRPDHPARLLLNAVAEAGAPWIADDDVDPQRIARLADVVDALAAAPHPDAGAFDTACRTFQAWLDPLARRAEISERRLVDAARGKARLELAKRRAAAVIAGRVGARMLPPFVQALLDHAWADALTLALLRHGEASAEWRERLDDTDALVAMAVGEGAGDASAALASHVRDALLQVGYHAEDAQAIATRLATGLDHATDDPAARTALAARLRARARLGDAGGDARATAVAPDARTREALDRLLAVPTGTWFEVDVPGGGHVRRRLAWHDAETDQALFVNLRGQRAAEPPLHEVASALADGTIRPVDAAAGTLVDRAWRDALAAMRAHLAGLGP